MEEFSSQGTIPMEFVTSNDIYVLQQKKDFQLYAPNPFMPYASLRFFKEKGSLMSYELKAGEKNLQIDERTLEVLHALGWEIQEPTLLNIIGEGIPDTGITSAYQSHTFKIENKSDYSISQPHWKFELYLINGNQSTITESNSFTFKIPPISDETLYKKNIEGDIEGTITYTCLLNGKYHTLIYNLSLELKPVIFHISTPNYTYQPENDTYCVDFLVQYGGSTFLHVGTEEDYVSAYIGQYIYEPYQAHIHVGPIRDYHDAWVDLTLKNQYGEIKHTIELYKKTIYLNKLINIGSDSIANFKKIDIYTANGTFNKRIFTTDDLQKLPKGFYILKYNDENQCIKTQKLIKQ